MARDELIDSDPTDVVLDADARQVVDGYLGALAALLPGRSRLREEIIAEIEDGLAEAVSTAVADGMDPATAAKDAVEEFGDPRTVASAYAPEINAYHARRVALTLLVSGPFVGILWLAAVAPEAFPPWRHLNAALDAAFTLIGPALVVGVPAAILAIAVTGQLSRWLEARSTIPAATAILAAGAAVIADTSLLIGYVAREASGSAFHQVAVLAVLASFVRLAFAGRFFHVSLRTFPSRS